MGFCQTNQVEIRLIGMSRSGNHCLVNWILKQIVGRFCFLNCAEGKTNPFLSTRPMEDGRSADTNIPELELQREQCGAFALKDYLVHSYEDCFLAHACSRWFDDEHDRWVGTSGRRIDLLLLRDPFNLFASRARLGIPLPDTTTRRMWKQHAKAFLKGSPHLRQESICVSYNEFVRSRRYRGELARKLGLSFSDRGIEEVPRCAAGSSFDGTSFHGEAWRMPVFERWKRYVADPRYRALFDAEIFELASQLFPHEGLPHDREWGEMRAPHRSHDEQQQSSDQTCHAAAGAEAA